MQESEQEIEVTSESWERARSDEQKQERVSEILKAVASLYEESEVDEINLAQIAKRAKFTRSNLYKYFESKEEIFLELIERDRAEWLVDLEKTFKGVHLNAAEFTATWVELHLRHERMTRLLTILNTVLEKNVTLEALIRFKKSYYEVEARVVEAITGVFPELSANLARDFFLSQLALTVGAYSFGNLNEKQLAAMKELGTSFEDEYFFELYANSIRALIESALARSRN